MTRPQGDRGHGIVRQTVAPVAHQRQAAGGKLHADLVRPPGEQLYPNQRQTGAAVQHPVAQAGLLNAA